MTASFRGASGPVAFKNGRYAGEVLHSWLLWSLASRIAHLLFDGNWKEQVNSLDCLPGNEFTDGRVLRMVLPTSRDIKADWTKLCCL